MLSLAPLAVGVLNAVLVLASPTQESLTSSITPGFNSKFFDVQLTIGQAHRGGRGNTVESTLPSFAWYSAVVVTTAYRGLVDGATTLELDNGITLDGETVVWHDEEIVPEKCLDTGPVVPEDPMYPYVGKFIANLTLAQIKTLDCGSKRQAKYQSKINPQHPNRTAGVQDFVQKQHAIFVSRPYYRSITYQSFDWRTLVAMKELDPTMITSALIDEETAFMPDNSTTPWLAGLRLDDFPGPSLGAKIAQAAHAINADILSPEGMTFIPSLDPSYEETHFTTQDMINEAHNLGLKVKPWTMNSLGRIEELVRWGADGIITDWLLREIIPETVAIGVLGQNCGALCAGRLRTTASLPCAALQPTRPNGKGDQTHFACLGA
ncbi:hypothetical protein HYDPIDRAFT_165390 [Hydnomerulius pinastri MD-312]|nr:hypothetical protein HYDPIDRAFT_165390 [Hydnomerulius pinastri MD-312]